MSRITLINVTRTYINALINHYKDEIMRIMFFVCLFESIDLFVYLVSNLRRIIIIRPRESDRMLHCCWCCIWLWTYGCLMLLMIIICKRGYCKCCYWQYIYISYIFWWQKSNITINHFPRQTQTRKLFVNQKEGGNRWWQKVFELEWERVVVVENICFKWAIPADIR